MAFSSDVFPNLVDHARMTNPDGTIAKIAWLLAQCNSVLKDMIWKVGNLPMGHKATVNSALPQGVWRGNNQGVPSSKPLFSQFDYSIGMLTDYSKVDKAMATLNGEVERFRWTQDQAHIQGMGQQVATAVFYSNEAVNPQQMTGFATYYSALNTSTQQTAKNVINAGGVGSSNASIWGIWWGDDTTAMIYPKGSQAGLQYEDKGDVRALYDANGNSYEGYTSYFEWKVGLAIDNWQYNVRIANIDTTTAGLLGTTPPDLNALMIQAIYKPPTTTRRISGITEVDSPGDPMPGTMPAFYMNRTVGAALDIQAIRDKNVLISMKEYAGEPVLMWRDIPTRIVDALINSEAAVS